MRGLQGRTVLLVGGTGGIGSATALRLGAEGANVVVGARNEEQVAQVVAAVTEAGGRAEAVRLDIADRSSIAAAIAHAVGVFGALDAVHLNAAEMSPDVIANDTDARTIDLAVFDRTVEVNLRGYLVCTQLALPALLDGDGGAVVYTSSAAAFVGEAERPAYAMTKSAVHALARHVASRWGKEGIRANAIAPGPVPSAAVLPYLDAAMIEGMTAAVRSPRIGKPEDIAALVAFLISDDGEWINGQVISVDGGMTLR
jgi:NAD(P)-dependent dehydrogenase (short-subunit alcohol dehydrogenase family)